MTYEHEPALGVHVTAPRILVARRVGTLKELRAYLQELDANGCPEETAVRVGNWQISAEWERTTP